MSGRGRLKWRNKHVDKQRRSRLRRRGIEETERRQRSDKGNLRHKGRLKGSENNKKERLRG